MDSQDSKPIQRFVRQEEMNELIASEKDPVTADLMSQAAYVLISRVLRHETGPVSDFDLYYFMEVIQEFVRDHDALRGVLEPGHVREEWLVLDDL